MNTDVHSWSHIDSVRILQQKNTATEYCAHTSRSQNNATEEYCDIAVFSQNTATEEYIYTPMYSYIWIVLNMYFLGIYEYWRIFMYLNPVSIFIYVNTPGSWRQLDWSADSLCGSARVWEGQYGYAWYSRLPQ